MEQMGITQEELDEFRFKFINQKYYLNKQSGSNTRRNRSTYNSVTSPSTNLNQNSVFAKEQKK